MNQEIILVNDRDEPIGYTSKYEAHKTGQLHRAFSVFLHSGDRLLIQQRADDKYHSPGLWANTCCSHPRKGEELKAAVDRRLMEEAGITCETEEVFSFIYKYRFEEELYEHEFDHVFLGEYSGEYRINTQEAKAFKWVRSDELLRNLEEHPEAYACWFRIAAPRVIELINKAREQV
ncbi:MAG: isopentenyl-diphosphate Delta-isomerase [Bacillota bacterium]|nr:isopentenyl-diphosphate Delta-isomerase [Bacillota bacterium]